MTDEDRAQWIPTRQRVVLAIVGTAGVRLDKPGRSLALIRLFLVVADYVSATGRPYTLGAGDREGINELLNLIMPVGSDAAPGEALQAIQAYVLPLGKIFVRPDANTIGVADGQPVIAAEIADPDVSKSGTDDPEVDEG